MPSDRLQKLININKALVDEVQMLRDRLEKLKANARPEEDRSEDEQLAEDGWIRFEDCMPPNGSHVLRMVSDEKKRRMPNQDDMPESFFVTPTHWKPDPDWNQTERRQSDARRDDKSTDTKPAASGHEDSPTR